MTDVRKLAEPTDELGRVETGVVQFGKDWPGYFIRGDNSFAIGMSLASVLLHFKKHPVDDSILVLQLMQLQSFYDDLRTTVLS